MIVGFATMKTMTATLKKTNFGTDAPTVIRNLFLIAILFSLMTCSVVLINHRIIFWVLLVEGILSSLTFALTALWMVYTSWVFKPKHLATLIDDLKLTGNEVILDMGCGKGIFLCEAAKRVTTGHVYGIDLWLNRDQSNNSENATWANAEILGINDRIDLQTADMCDIPFADDKFDIIISNLAIHNISDEKGRIIALKELLRTLKPGGRFVISDIFATKQYVQFFATQENVEFTVSKPSYLSCPPVTVIAGTKTK